MSLTSQLATFVTRVGTEFKAVRATIGSLASLSTTEKGSLVGAINEVNAGVGSGGNITADAITDATTVGKDVLRAANGLAARNAIGAGTSSLIIGTTEDTAKAGNYAPTWGEVSGKPTIIASGADAAAARTSIGAQSAADVDSRISDLIGGAPAALDTLGEIATALTENEGSIGTLVTGLSNRVAVDSVQSFTEPQKQQARDNIDVYSKTEIGNVETDLVAVFEAALV